MVDNTWIDSLPKQSFSSSRFTPALDGHAGRLPLLWIQHGSSVRCEINSDLIHFHERIFINLIT